MLFLLALPPILFTAGPTDRPRVELLARSARPLVPSFYCSSDPAPSFDAKRVLFAGKRTASDAEQTGEGFR